MPFSVLPQSLVLRFLYRFAGHVRFPPTVMPGRIGAVNTLAPARFLCLVGYGQQKHEKLNRHVVYVKLGGELVAYYVRDVDESLPVVPVDQFAQGGA